MDLTFSQRHRWSSPSRTWRLQAKVVDLLGLPHTIPREQVLAACLQKDGEKLRSLLDGIHFANVHRLKQLQSLSEQQSK